MLFVIYIKFSDAKKPAEPNLDNSLHGRWLACGRASIKGI